MARPLDSTRLLSTDSGSKSPACSREQEGGELRRTLWPEWSPPKSGVLSLLPLALVPYAELSRIEQSGGLYAVYFPYVVGLSYAACVTSPLLLVSTILSTAGILLIWNIFSRGAACTINDIVDREYDRMVACYRTRPIARRALTPGQGYIWYAVQTVLGILSVWQFPHNCLLHGAAIQSCLPVSWAIVMSCASVGSDPFLIDSLQTALGTGTLVLSYAVWAVVFDYVNACQDTADDIKAGVRSMAVLYQKTERFIGTLEALQVTCLAATGLLAGFGPLYLTAACSGNAALFTTMALTAKRDRPRACAWWFSWGGLLFGGTTVFGFLAEYEMRRRAAQAGNEAIPVL